MSYDLNIKIDNDIVTNADNMDTAVISGEVHITHVDGSNSGTGTGSLNVTVGANTYYFNSFSVINDPFGGGTKVVAFDDTRTNLVDFYFYGDDPPNAVHLEYEKITSSGYINYENNNATVTSTPACYCTGTLISTSSAGILVENLVIGDLVATASGEQRAIKWIGKRSYSARFARNNPDLLPICFKAGSLADGVPSRDLWVSPKHAMFINDVLVPAEHLVNGVTITKAEKATDITYWHVELDSHDVLIAEGAPSESFVDDNSRGMFHNAHTFREMYPDALAAPAVYCAPRIEGGYALDAIRRRLADRAGIAVQTQVFGQLHGMIDVADGVVVQGWAQDAAYPNGPVCLDIVVDGVVVSTVYAEEFRPDLRAAGVGDGYHAFNVRFPKPLDVTVPHTIEVRRSVDGVAIAGTTRLESYATIAA